MSGISEHRPPGGIEEWRNHTVMNSFICFCSMRFCSSCCSFMLRLLMNVSDPGHDILESCLPFHSG